MRAKTFVLPFAIAASTLMTSCLPGRTEAMEFQTKRLDASTVLIGGSGEVQSGDSERFMAVLLTIPRDGLNILALNSIGGNVLASEALASAIRRTKVATLVGDKSVCASACFILFAAGASKHYLPGARIGVHSAISGAYETMDSMAITTVMARSASEMGVPVSIVGRMVSTTPGNMAWLSEAELMSMGARRLAGSDPEPSGTAKPAPASGSVASYAPKSPDNSAATPPAATPSRPGAVAKDEQSPSYQLGRTDRTAWEQWYATLDGEAKLGAEYWTAERSKRNPGNCIGTPSFQQACAMARQRLAGPDMKRKTDAQYWFGWNSL